MYVMTCSPRTCKECGELMCCIIILVICFLILSFISSMLKSEDDALTLSPTTSWHGVNILMSTVSPTLSPTETPFHVELRETIAPLSFENIISKSQESSFNFTSVLTCAFELEGKIKRCAFFITCIFLILPFINKAYNLHFQRYMDPTSVVVEYPQSESNRFNAKLQILSYKLGEYFICLFWFIFIIGLITFAFTMMLYGYGIYSNCK